MGVLFVWLWIAGGFPAAVLGEVVQAESPRIARAGRIAFALLLAFDLLLAALVFLVGTEAPTTHMTRNLWWFTIIVAGVPLALVSGLAVRRGYAGHRVALAAATLTTAALYVAFPLGFAAEGQPLTGLGRFEHDHHALDVAILLIPTLILLANELRWKQQVEPSPEVAPGPEEDQPSLRSRIAVTPRRKVIGAVVLLVVFIWLAGTNGPGQLVGFGVLAAGSALYLWQWHRSTMRSVLRDLRPPEKS
ncbi:MAG: hypothetical protein ACXVRV_03235 [Gaiellaceae bacterium]